MTGSVTQGSTRDARDAAAAPAQLKHSVAVDPTWRSWSGAHGGYIAGLALDAARQHVGTDRPVRALSMSFLAPVDEPRLTFSSVLEHHGRGTSVVSLRGRQRGGAVLLGSATLGAARPGPGYTGRPLPPVPAPQDCAPFALPVDLVPFTGHIEVRPATPTLPLSGGDSALMVAWMRFRDGRGIDAASAVVLADSAPPALYATWTRPRPVPSVEMAVHFTDALDAGPVGDWVLVRIRGDQAGSGWATDDSAVWATDGRLLAQARQIRRVL